MKVFFDNCTSPIFASTLHGFIQHEGHQAVHIKNITGLSKGRSSPDLEWINFLKSSNEFWIFVTGDGRILKNKAERLALRSAGLHGFVMAPAYQKTPLNQVAASLVFKWPEVFELTQLLQAPSMHEIPIGKNTKLRPLPL